MPDSNIYTSKLNTGRLTFEGVQIKGALGGSGDGLGSDTIELVPDVDLYTAHQYLVIDPTDPDHIHIRAGGPQDDSDATLILGGEKSNITIDDQADGHVSILSRTADNSTSHIWKFNNDGNITIPNLKDIRDVAGNTAIGGGNRVKEYNSSGGATVPIDENNIYSINTTTQATTVKLPASGTTPIGYEFTVIDSIGNALSKNITVTAESGDSIISAPSGIAIDTNYGLLAFKYIGNKNWAILYGR